MIRFQGEEWHYPDETPEEMIAGYDKDLLFFKKLLANSRNNKEVRQKIKEGIDILVQAKKEYLETLERDENHA